MYWQELRISIDDEGLCFVCSDTKILFWLMPPPKVPNDAKSFAYSRPRWTISGFRRSVNGIFALLGCYAA